MILDSQPLTSPDVHSRRCLNTQCSHLDTLPRGTSAFASNRVSSLPLSTLRFSPGGMHGAHTLFTRRLLHSLSNANELLGNLNGPELRLVEIFCQSCARNSGTTLFVPLSAAGGFLGGGQGQSFSLPLSQGRGWLKDPKNSLVDAAAPTVCEMAEVLSNISELRILGGEGRAITAYYSCRAGDIHRYHSCESCRSKAARESCVLHWYSAGCSLNVS